jgi:hypothetical protein
VIGAPWAARGDWHRKPIQGCTWATWTGHPRFVASANLANADAIQTAVKIRYARAGRRWRRRWGQDRAANELDRGVLEGAHARIAATIHVHGVGHNSAAQPCQVVTGLAQSHEYLVLKPFSLTIVLFQRIAWPH